MAYGGDITCASAGAVSTNKPVSGIGAVQYIGVQQPAGTALADNGQAIDFGNVDLSATKTFVVTNSGNITLTLSGITKGGTHSNEFTVGGTLPASLAVGASTNFTVTFRPAALGERTAALHIGNGAGDGSFDIALKGTGVTPPYLAFGGDVKLLWTNNTTVYAVHVFMNVGTANFILSKNINAGVLVVGGGGSAGGGAVVYVTNATVNAGTYTVTVGAGGGAPAGGAYVGSNGVASSVTFGSTISAAGGGGGGAYADGNGTNGGCGGGASASYFGTPTGGCGYVASGGHAAFTTGSSLGGFASGAIYGNPGGNVTNIRVIIPGHPAMDATYARGGGGAGVAATDGPACTNSAGDGGDGIQILDYALGGSYSNLYWGGGGGGGAYHARTGEHGGAGGKGGGGGGGTGVGDSGDGPGVAGGDNTGGGGGGAGGYQAAGAKGGSGIVIIRYAIIPPKGTVFMMR